MLPRLPMLPVLLLPTIPMPPVLPVLPVLPIVPLVASVDVNVVTATASAWPRAVCKTCILNSNRPGIKRDKQCSHIKISVCWQFDAFFRTFWNDTRNGKWAKLKKQRRNNIISTEILKSKISPIGNGILLPTVRKNCSRDREKLWNSRPRPRIWKCFAMTRTIYSNSEKLVQFLVTECFFNLFLDVSNI